MIQDILNLQEQSIRHEQARIHMVKRESLSMDAQTDTSVSYTQIEGVGGGTYNYVPIVTNYGFTSVPLSGSDAITLNQYGRDDNKIVIGTHDARYHPVGLGSGETQIYDNAGQKVYLSGVNGTIIIDGKTEIDIQIGGSTIFSIKNGSVSLTGDLNVSGTITANGDVKAGSISLSSHVHGGVQGGSSETSAPR